MMTVPGYNLIAPLYKGDDLALYQATRELDGLPLLIKLPVTSRPAPTLARRLEHEYELTRDLDSDLIPRPLALKRYAGTVALILEQGPTRSLASLLGSPMDIDSFLRIAVGLTVALTELHRHDLVHKDIKPENVLLDNTDHVWLTGLGVASRLPRECQTPEPPEIIAGTLAYMAPEQTGRMNRSIDSRSDLYSLGVTFYQMLTGVLPFSASDPMEWVHCHLARQPVPPIQREPGLPAQLSKMVMKLLAKTGEERYQSAAGLHADLSHCLTQWESKARIVPFPLARHDVADRLLIPEKLYGREAEINTLLAAFDRVVTSGMVEIVLVSGYSGIGKTAVVSELHKALVPPRGLFAAGKFDQYKRDIPYATLVQALRSLVRHILAKSEADIEAWRDVISSAVTPNGQLVVSLIPEVELIIGKQPPVPELPPQEAQNRFKMVLHGFLGCFAAPEHPLVLFLDDLQWLDRATLELIEHLGSEQEVKHLLLIGAYRDNEVGPTHPLTRILEKLRKSGARLREIVLTPLDMDDVCSLIVDSLHCEPEHALPLAKLVHEKTGGNPFFAIQFLIAMVDEKLLAFDPGAGKWTWDLTRIHAKGFSDNVVDLMVAKLGRLSGPSQEVLKQFACLGIVAEITTLSLVCGQSEEALHAAFREAVRAGLVFRQDHSYAFLHDRVQEAAYALVPEAERQELHLRIGRLLLARYAQQEMDEHVFDVVDQFNRAMDIVTNAEELETLCRLNTAAGRKARGAVAYRSARRYLAQAVALLPTNCWDELYRESLALHLELAECEYLVGNFEQADKWLTLVLAQARSLLDRARTYRLRQRLYQLSGRFHDAMMVALEALRLFAIQLPEKDEDIKAAFDAENGLVEVNLKGRSMADLADIPLSEDAEARALIGLLAEASPLIYTVRPLLWPLITAKGVNLSLQHGHADESPFIYSCYTMVLVGVCRDIPSALRFSRMALRLSDRLPGAAVWKGKVMFHDAAVVGIWGRHFAENLPILDQAFQACIDSGDFVHAGYLTYNAIWLHLENGDSLDQVVELARRFEDFARKNHNDIVYNVDQVEKQFALCLQGRTRSETDFSDAAFDEAHCVAAIDQSGFGLGTAYHRIMKLMTAYLASQYDEALKWADLAAPMLLQVASMANEATYHFYQALTLAALYEETPSRRKEFMEKLTDVLAKLKYWTKHCPENFANRTFLVSAEIARLEKQDMEAMRLYDEAIGSARDNAFVHQEALACELASRFYRVRGFDRIADAYLQDAHARYAGWGAWGKVGQLEGLHPWLAQIRHTEATTLAEHLDAVSLAKAQRAISSEINLDRLAKKLLRIVMESAGAQTGFLSMEGACRLRAEMQPNNNGKQEIVFDLSPPDSDIPETIINYVRHSRETVILDDAGTHIGEFSTDAYLRRVRPKSVLCMGIRRKEKLLGVLYLENDLVTGAFTAEHRSVLEVLAAQAAISLEISSAYEALREGEERLRLTLAATHIGVFDWDIEHDTWYASPENYSMLGYEAKDGPGDRNEWLARVHPDDRDQVRAEIRKVLASESSLKGPQMYEYEARVLHADGSYRWEHVKGIGIKLDEQGRVMRMLGIRMDITDRKLAEEELKRHRDHLEEMISERTAELAEAKEQAEQANLAKSIFLANMSHELRTPLNAVLGFSQLMRNDLNVTAEQKESLDIITRSGNHLLHLINNVLDISKIEAGRMEVAESSIDLHQLIEEIKSVQFARAHEKGLDFTLEESPDLPRHIKADAGKLRQVLLNLIGNGVKYTASGGVTLRVSVTVGKSDERLRLRFEVEDSGPGIREEDRERIFSPFVQLGEKPPTEAGTGLGLTICRQFVELMGGEIDVKEAPGRGSIFWFTLPVEVLPSGEDVAKPAHGRVIGLAKGEPRYRLLIAEDQPENRLLLRKLLAPLGFELMEAVNGQEAVMVCDKWDPDLVFMDIRMPVMDGLTATRRIKALDKEAATRIVAVTAHAFEEERREILAAGCDGFIRKPYEQNDIFATLTRHLGVHFVYDQEEASVPSASQVDAAALAGLPERLRDELEEALSRLDMEAVQAAIAEIATLNPALADSLTAEAKDLQFGRLLRVLRA